MLEFYSDDWIKFFNKESNEFQISLISSFTQAVIIQ